jgi:agmatinase
VIKRKLWGDLYEEGEQVPRPDVVIMGIPYDSSACYRKGAAFAPAKLRDLSRKSSAVTEDGILLDKLSIMDIGDVEISLDVSHFFDTVRKKAAGSPDDAFLLSLGGDHSVTIPLIQAFAERDSSDFGLIWLDAHLDLWDVYDNSLYSHACPMRRALELSNLKADKIVGIGMRCYSPGELQFIAEKGIKMITAAQCAHQSVEETARQAVQRSNGVSRIYLSLDIDMLDPAFAPGTGIPKGGGVSTRFLLDLLKVLFKNLPIESADLVEISPPLDFSDITSFAGVGIIFEILGQLQQKKLAK